MSQQKKSGAPVSFPSSEERKRITDRRSALSYALYLQLALRETDPTGADTRREELIRAYGFSEVQRMMDRIGRQLQAQRPRGEGEDEWLYHDYVERYRRWGGKRRLLPMDEERRLNYERTVLKTRQDYHTGRFDLEVPIRLPPLNPAEERRLAELTDLLLADADLWDDLVPEDPPAVLPPLPVRLPTSTSVAPQPALAEQVDDLVARGAMLFQERKTAAACNFWLEAWTLVRQLARPEHRTAFQFSRAYDLVHSVDTWTGELLWELGNAGIDDPVYSERQLQFGREYLEQFPGAEPNTVVNMLRAQGEALWRLGRRPEAEATYAALVERLPDEGWGYIGWSDQYWLFRLEKTPAEYEPGEAILKRALTRPRLRDREHVLERLGDLYSEWDKPTEHARVAAELAKLRRAQTGQRSAPVVRVPAPGSQGKLGRNEPCWCGSGRKYKHCHLQADQAR